jgi:hypothetical protein
MDVLSSYFFRGKIETFYVNVVFSLRRYIDHDNVKESKFT